MDKFVKSSTYVGGGGLIVSSGIAAEEYFMKDSGEEISFAATRQLVVTPVESKEETVRDVLTRENLVLASTFEEFKKIFEDIKKAGFSGWGSQIMKNYYGITNSSSQEIPKTMQRGCDSQMSKKYSEFKNAKRDDWKWTELKVIKMVCTKNYSIIDNAKDYWGEDKTVYESTNIRDDKWKDLIQRFKGKRGNEGKTPDDMKKECLDIGKNPYITNPPKKNGFYDFCVIK